MYVYVMWGKNNQTRITSIPATHWKTTNFQLTHFSSFQVLRMRTNFQDFEGLTSRTSLSRGTSRTRNSLSLGLDKSLIYITGKNIPLPKVPLNKCAKMLNIRCYTNHASRKSQIRRTVRE